MGLRYRVPLPGPFYYLGCVGPERWLPRSSNTGTGPVGFVVKWFIIYPSIVFFGAGLAIMVAPFFGVVGLFAWPRFTGATCPGRESYLGPHSQRCQDSVLDPSGWSAEEANLVFLSRGSGCAEAFDR